MLGSVAAATPIPSDIATAEPHPVDLGRAENGHENETKRSGHRVRWRTSPHVRAPWVDSESHSGPIVKHQWPLVFDLIEDPSEARDLIDLRLD